jgi:dTDP-4-dehydrorhamnose reductase
MVCGGQTSRLEVAPELLSLLNLTDSVRLQPVESSYFSEEYFAPRPACERLVNRKLDLRGLNIMRDWRVALKEYLSTYYQGYLA